MKRMVVVGIMAVLACALFLVPYASAKVELSCSVYPEKAEYDKEFVYSITLTNSGYQTIGELSLIVGSDFDNMDITREWEVTDMKLEPGSPGEIENGKIRIKKGESCTVIKKGVDFKNPKLKKGAFRDWTENPKSPEWDRAWYECCFKPFLGDEVCDDGTGKPKLTRPITRFYDSSVKYNETGCLDKLSFDYGIRLWQNENKTIVLKARNYSTSAITDWDTKATYQDCPKGMHIIKFPNVTLNQDNLIAVKNGAYNGEYTFEGWNPSDEYIGPNITENFSKLKVDPRSGTNKRNFTYSVEVDASICDKIELLVFNYSIGVSGEYCDSKGIQNYTRVGSEELLTWPDITLNQHELNQSNDSKFKFVSIFCGKEEKGNLPIWPINETWNNPNVEPDGGLYNSKFSYSLELKADKKLKVKLILYYPTKGEATIDDPTREYTDAGKWQTLYWNDTRPFEEKDEGSAEYKFKFYYEQDEINDTEDHEGSRYTGPSIGIAEFKNNSVKPENGTRETEFTYRVNVSAVESAYLTLKVCDSGGTVITEITKSDKKTSPNWEVFEFKNVTFEHVPPAALGNASYVFWVKNTPSTNYVGPFLIIEKIENFTVTPKEGTNATPFTFCVDVNSTEKENVTLQVSSNETKWINVCSRPYENVSNEKHICFSDISVDSSNLTPEEKRNLTSEWKKNKNISWRVKGLVNESITIPTRYNVSLKWYNSSVSPEEGWWYDSFSFKVSLSAIENGTVALQVKLNESDSDWQNRGKAYNYSRPDPESYTWLKETLCDDSFAGNTGYRFEFTCGNAPYYSNKSGLDGPKLFIPLNISFTDDCVEEKEDVIFNKTFGGLFNETSNTFFNFSINVTANDTTAVDLIVVDSDNNHHPERDYKIYDTEPPQRLRFTWTRKELPLAEIGNWNYTFRYNDSRYGTMTYNKTFVGPRIIAVFNDYEIDPYPILFNRKHNVTVWMTGTIPMEIELESFNLYQNKRIWEPVGTRDYEPPGEQPLNWTINTFDIPFDNLRLNWKKKENGE